MRVGLNPQLSKLGINEWFAIGRLTCPIGGESKPSPKLVPFWEGANVAIFNSENVRFEVNGPLIRLAFNQELGVKKSWDQ